MAERVGFEPTVAEATRALQARLINHSSTSPAGGEGGIRTHARRSETAFRERHHKPLGHLSAVNIKLKRAASADHKRAGTGFQTVHHPTSHSVPCRKSFVKTVQMRSFETATSTDININGRTSHLSVNPKHCPVTFHIPKREVRVNSYKNVTGASWFTHLRMLPGGRCRLSPIRLFEFPGSLCDFDHLG